MRMEKWKMNILHTTSNQYLSGCVFKLSFRTVTFYSAKNKSKQNEQASRTRISQNKDT